MWESLPTGGSHHKEAQMRVVLAALLLMGLALPAVAQEPEAKPQALFFLDLGPGFFTSLDDSSSTRTLASGVTQYVGIGAYLGKTVALAFRVNMLQTDEKSVTTSVWGWLLYTFGSTGPGPYLGAGVGTTFDGNWKFAGRGGYQVALFADDALAFLEAEGRYVNEEEVTSAALANVGLRFNWGRQ